MCATEPNRVVTGQYVAEDQGKQDNLFEDELLKRKVINLLKPRKHKLCKEMIKKKTSKPKQNINNKNLLKTRRWK